MVASPDVVDRRLAHALRLGHQTATPVVSKYSIALKTQWVRGSRSGWSGAGFLS
jgi:hypothetical protein